MDSIFPFRGDSHPYNMSAYPGARRVTAHSDITVILIMVGDESARIIPQSAIECIDLNEAV